MKLNPLHYFTLVCIACALWISYYDATTGFAQDATRSPVPSATAAAVIEAQAAVAQATETVEAPLAVIAETNPVWYFAGFIIAILLTCLVYAMYMLGISTPPAAAALLATQMPTAATVQAAADKISHTVLNDDNPNNDWQHPVAQGSAKVYGAVRPNNPEPAKSTGDLQAVPKADNEAATDNTP